ncbi:MAG: MBL fold metallo-hydrolase [Rudaea sp.]
MLSRLSENLFRFTDTCQVYVIRSGREAVLVDFGAGDVLDRLASIGIDRVTDVLMTHHHRDQGQGLERAVRAGRASGHREPSRSFSPASTDTGRPAK